VISTAAVHELVGRMITDELVVMPVRNHSPACAVQVRDAIRERRPSVVLIEGPRSFDALAGLLASPEAVMPVAVYSYYADGSERASAYYPFCDYSPELVALREAAVSGIPARFVDLDFAEQSRAERSRAADALDTGRDHRSLLDENEYVHSRTLRLLAERLGCRDHEDLWEHLFEVRPAPLADHVARVAAYCRLARIDHDEDRLRADGTLAREAEMAHHVREALAARRPGDGPVLVVLGGFHAIVLPDLVAAEVVRPVFDDLPAEAGSALIRYSFDRLERLNGYAAGMTAPAWHQLLWEHLTGPASGESARTAATLVALLDITEDLRRSNRVAVPLPSVSAAFGQALQLADLRDRGAPLRSDLLDAVASCFVKGELDVEGRLVLAAAHRVLTGDRVGTVPSGAGAPPLVADALERLRGQRLNVDALDRQATSLDIYRRPAHRVTSRLLHGLQLLGVPFATRTGGPDFVAGHSLGRLQERWDYQWSPGVEGALVEAAVYGTTVPDAVDARFQRRVADHVESADRLDAETSVQLLAHACVLGLHRRADEVLDVVRDGLAADPSFGGVAAAVAQLSLLWESREPLEARALDGLPELVRTAYARAIYLGRGDGGQATEPGSVVTALVKLRELTVSEAGADLDHELFWDLVAGLRREHGSPLVRGGATGLAYSAGRVDEAELGMVVQGQLSGTVPPADAVQYLGGLLGTAREAAWQNSHLLTGLDSLFRDWDHDTFVEHLPELRLAFAEMTPTETDRIGETVAALHGLGSIGPLSVRDEDEQEVLGRLQLSTRVAELLDRDGLADWAGA